MRRAAILLVILVTGCRLGDLVGPVPQYVQGCIRYQTVSITVLVEGRAPEVRQYSVCLERGWVRKVDTIPTPLLPMKP